MPECRPIDADQQLGYSRCFAEMVRRTDHRIGSVQHGIAESIL
jgi:hypothetical protein